MTESERIAALRGARRAGPAPTPKPGARPLLSAQAEAYGQIALCGGALLPMGVGSGKTLVACLAGAAIRSGGRPCSVTVVFVPSNTLDQFRRALAQARTEYDCGEVRVISYESVSQPDGEALLDFPENACIVLDEAHRVREGTARTGRLLRALARPDLYLVALSGTFFAKSIVTYSHIAARALGLLSPLPRTWADRQAWAAVIDADGIPEPWHRTTLAPLVGREMDRAPWPQYRDAVRKSVHAILSAAPGVVLTTGALAKSALRIRALRDIPISDALQKALTNAWQGIQPDGVPCLGPADAGRLRAQLSMGFFYRWVEAPPDEWAEARAAWARALRYLLRDAEPGRDSPLLVARAAERAYRAGVRGPVEMAWARWAAVRDTYVPKTEAVWIDKGPFLWFVARFRAELEPCVFWYQSTAIAQALDREGVFVQPNGAWDASRDACAASIAAHGEGKNLQAYRRAIVAQLPRSGKGMEQLLGRHYRTGQESDVCFDVAAHTLDNRRVLRQVTKAAQVTESVTHSRQRINSAEWI